MVSVQHCATLRAIIFHWKNCTRDDCPVCSPLRKAHSGKRDSAGMMLPQNSSLTLTPVVTTSCTSQSAVDSGTHDGTNIMCKISESVGGQTSSTSSTASSSGVSSSAVTFSSKLSSASSCVSSIVTAFEMQSNMLMSSTSSISTITSDTSSRPSKEWQTHIAPDLRNHLVQKLYVTFHYIFNSVCQNENYEILLIGDGTRYPAQVSGVW